jgi:hypothetical protein
VAFAPDGKSIVSAGWDSMYGGAVDVWDVENRSRIRSLDEGVNLTPFTSLDFSPDGALLALALKTACSEATPSVHLWDAASGQELRRWEKEVSVAPRRRDFAGIRFDRKRAVPFGRIRFTRDGRSLLVADGASLRLIEVATGEERAVLAELPRSRLGGGDPWQTTVGALAVAPDGRLVFCGCADGLIRIVDLLDERRVPPLAGHSGRVEALRFLPDGRLLSFGRDNRLVTWNPAAALGAKGQFAPAPSPDELVRLWDDLGSDDLGQRNRAKLTLAMSQGAADALRGRVHAVPPVDSKRITALVAQLASEDYNERRRAAAELRKFGDLALPALRAAERTEISGALITNLEADFPTAEQQRCLEAVEILELIGGEDARTVLAELAKGAAESSLSERAGQALQRVTAAAGGSSDAKLDELWANLASNDAKVAWRSIQILALRKDAAAMLGQRLEAMSGQLGESSNPERIARLIAELDHDDFPVREAASRSLAGLGPAAEPALKATLQSTTSPEVRLRITSLLRTMGTAPPSGDHLAPLRALEALELSGSPEAREELKRLSTILPAGSLKDAIAASVLRLER